MQALVPAGHGAANERKSGVLIGRHRFGRVHDEEDAHVGGANLTRRERRCKWPSAILLSWAAMSRPWLIPVCGGLCAFAFVLAAPGGHAESKPAHAALATE